MTGSVAINLEDVLIAEGHPTDMTDALNAAFPLLPRHMVLEVGCGSGKLSMSLASSIGCQVTLLDADPAVLQRAQRIKWAVQGLKGRDIPAWIVKGDMLELPWDDDTFHVVWNEGSLEHFQNPVVPLREMVRVSKDAVSIVTPNARNELQVTLAKNQSAEYSKTDPGHWAAYEKPMTVEEVHALLENAGLGEVQAKPIWYERNPPRGEQDYRMVFGFGRKKAR